MSLAHTSIPTSPSISRFTYAIRNIVAEAQKVEATGTRVRYLNIGDPVAFGFKTPPHLVDAVERAMRDGHNSYGPSAGIAARAKRSPPSTRATDFRSSPIACSSPPARRKGSSSR